MKRNLLALLMIASILLSTSCTREDVNEEPIEDIAVKPGTLRIEKGKTSEVSVTAGSGKYVVVSMDTKVASAKLENAKIIVTAIEKGETQITVTDTETKKMAEIAVSVFVVYPDVSVNPTALTIDIGEKIESAITAGSGSYKATSDKPEIATAEVEADKVIVTAVENGEAKITVTDTETKKTAEIAVSVKRYAMTFTTTNETSVKLIIDAEEANRAKIWIDLNGNGTKDKGEDNITFGKRSEYAIENKTITIHGKVTKFDCSNNNITEINIKNNTELLEFLMYRNPCTQIDLSQNTKLVLFHGTSCGLQAIDISKNTELTSFSCGNNKLTELDLSNNPKLTFIHIAYCLLPSLNLSKQTELKELNCFRNKIAELNLSHCVKLESIDCSNNALEVLDVSKNTALKELRCYVNKLTAMDLSQNKMLEYFHFSRNQISGENMTKLMRSLVDRTGLEKKGTVGVINLTSSDGNVCNKDQVKIATDKNWAVQSYDGEPYEGS